MKYFLVLAQVLFVYLVSQAQINLIVDVKNGDLNVCPNEDIQFKVEGTYTGSTAQLDPNTTTYTWTVDGNVESGTNLWLSSEYNFTDGQTIHVKCEVEDKDGLTAQQSIVVKVATAPTISVSASEENICVASTVTLTATISAGISGAHVHTYESDQQRWSGNRVPGATGATTTFSPLTTEGEQTYNFTTQDDYGCYHSKSLNIEALEADFTTNSGSENQAKFELIITNECTNATKISWKVLDENEEVIAEVLGDKALQNEVMYTIEKPGNYGILVEASYGSCVKSKKQAGEGEWVIVIDSYLDEEMPNVFTPNGDGLNDFFTVDAPKSMREYKVVILNRWGRKVFEYDVDNMKNPQDDEWMTSEAGWDGNLKGGAEAASGSYFFIITAVGYDDLQHQYKGSLLLVRNK